MNANFMTTDPTFEAQALAAFELFIGLATELSVLFIAISFFVALVNQKLSKKRIRGLLGGRRGRGYLMAAGLGSITPFCSCSTIPLLIGLLKARAGFGPTITFLFTSPLLNPIIIVLFLSVFGLTITLTYATIALGVSVVAGFLLQRLGFERFVRADLLEVESPGCEASTSNDGCSSAAQAQTAPLSYRRAWQEALTLFRSMAPYMLVAMAIGALAHGFVPAQFFAETAGSNNPWAVPTAAIIGIPLYVRVSTLLPLAASLVTKGVSLGAIMALTIGSGGASIPELVMLKRLFHWPMMLAFVAVILFMSISAGLIFNAFFMP